MPPRLSLATPRPRLVRVAATLSVSIAFATGVVATAPTAHAEAIVTEDSVDATIPEAVDLLVVASEDRTGYERTKFRHWVDADGDGCDTRKEVLIAEAVKTPTKGTSCTLTGGSWYSYYDGVTWTDQSRIDIDHMVALAEAWDSGASRWTDAKRQGYANDLTEPVALVGVTDTVNQAKGDKDPKEWMPAREKCRYLAEWVTVKVRWNLSVDPAEKTSILSQASGCSTRVSTTLA